MKKGEDLVGLQGMDGCAPLSASDLRALMNRMQVRSEHVKDSVRSCISTQHAEFASSITQASTSLHRFSQVAQDLESLLDVSDDPLSLCSLSSDLVQKIRQVNVESSETRKAILTIQRLSQLYEILLTAAVQFSRGDLVASAQGLLDAKRKLGLCKQDPDATSTEEELIMPYLSLKQLCFDSCSQMSSQLGDLFSKLVVVDDHASKLHIQNSVQLSSLLRAMDEMGLLDITFARLADALTKTVISFILQNPVEVVLSEELSATGESALGWALVPKAEEDCALLGTLYTKLLQLAKFLWVNLNCGEQSWMRSLGRYIWPRMADAIIAGYLSKAVPNEVSEVARFQESATLTFEFEKALSKLNLIAELSPAGDKLGSFASDVELHFALKKKAQILSRVRRLLLRSDFSKRGDLKGASGSNRNRLDQNRTELFFQSESCTISHAAKQLMDIVHDSLADTCMANSRISVELYNAARDALLLYAAIVPVKLAKELKGLSLEAIIHHNDCLYLAHESLALMYQYGDAFPMKLKESCMFADLFPIFKEMADQVLKQQLQFVLMDIHEALDQGSGFRDTHEPHSYKMASLALDQVVFNLEKARMLWKPVLMHSVYASSLGCLMTVVFGRLASEILDCNDMDMREIEQLHKLILSLDDRLLPTLQSLVDNGKQQGADLGGSCGILTEVGRLVPTWCKLLRLAELLDMSLISITRAWENGSLAVSGFSASEVQKVIKAVFQDTELRKESLTRVASFKDFSEVGKGKM